MGDLDVIKERVPKHACSDDYDANNMASSSTSSCSFNSNNNERVINQKVQ